MYLYRSLKKGGGELFTQIRPVVNSKFQKVEYINDVIFEIDEGYGSYKICVTSSNIFNDLSVTCDRTFHKGELCFGSKKGAVSRAFNIFHYLQVVLFI
jgi:hypothetical protein